MASRPVKEDSGVRTWQINATRVKWYIRLLKYRAAVPMLYQGSAQSVPAVHLSGVICFSAVDVKVSANDDIGGLSRPQHSAG